MRFPLTADERTYLDDLWRKLRHATHQTNTASARWNKVNDELTSLAERSDWDDLKTDRVKAVNLRLNGAYAAWNFWQQEARRLAAAIQAERALRELMGVVDDDPTGLGYSRDDDDDLPPPPLPEGVDGLSITGRAPRRRPSPNAPAGSAFDTVERRTHQSSGRPGSELGAAGAGVPAAPTGGDRR
ncbi:hypothetical protein [Micromonospora deserti]|uniref:Uncharacterized protein n=1 Tax=Micromonospora deserti TaxID=2070366 RepID=A0A2W2DF89_9ACTN|nr:hypothetical protein [Micromonospora deserti]PZF98517.1 hypothetical protein C1I99_13225 [Micromonospora deserti]